MNSRPGDIIAPHSGVGICAPRPINENPDAAINAFPIYRNLGINMT